VPDRAPSSPLPRVFPALLLGLTTFPSLACRAGDDVRPTYGPLATCEEAAVHLRDCGLLTEGTLRCAWWSPESDFDACVTDCLARLPCSELERDICFQPHGDPSPVDACADACIPHAHCDDGTRIEAELFCDGFEGDCPAGSDEDCPDFTCHDGTTIPGDLACDYWVDCAEGEDEITCPGFELCDSGEEAYPVASRCDEAPFCDDGSDDADCGGVVRARYLCPDWYVCLDGSSLDGFRFCDGVDDCAQHEDETGCY